MTPWTVAHQASLSMEFSRREYWSGLPFPSLEELPNPGIKPLSPAWQADSLLFELQGSLFTHSLPQLYSLSLPSDFPGGGSGTEPVCQCRKCKRRRFRLWLRGSPGGGHGNQLQDSSLKGPMDRGAWLAMVHRVAKSRT